MLRVSIWEEYTLTLYQYLHVYQSDNACSRNENDVNIDWIKENRQQQQQQQRTQYTYCVSNNFALLFFDENYLNISEERRNHKKNNK